MPGCAYLTRLSQVQSGLSMSKHGLKIQAGLVCYGVEPTWVDSELIASLFHPKGWQISRYYLLTLSNDIQIIYIINTFYTTDAYNYSPFTLMHYTQSINGKKSIKNLTNFYRHYFVTRLIMLHHHKTFFRDVDMHQIYLLALIFLHTIRSYFNRVQFCQWVTVLIWESASLKCMALMPKYSGQVTGRYNGCWPGPTSLSEGHNCTSGGGPHKYATESRWAAPFTTARCRALGYRPLDRTWRRSPTLITNAPGNDGTVTHFPDSPLRTCKPGVLLWWSMVRKGESVCSARPMAWSGLGQAG